MGTLPRSVEARIRSRPYSGGLVPPGSTAAFAVSNSRRPISWRSAPGSVSSTSKKSNCSGTSPPGVVLGQLAVEDVGEPTEEVDLLGTVQRAVADRCRVLANSWEGTGCRVAGRTASTARPAPPRPRGRSGALRHDGAPGPGRAPSLRPIRGSAGVRAPPGWGSRGPVRRPRRGRPRPGRTSLRGSPHRRAPAPRSPTRTRRPSCVR